MILFWFAMFFLSVVGFAAVAFLLGAFDQYPSEIAREAFDPYKE